jgi:ParB/RepB/Spo0J family partition protein
MSKQDRRQRRRRATPETQLVPILEIDCGGRHRKDEGDIDGLGASINEVGLLQPIVVTDDPRFIKDKKCKYRLVAGDRRLTAVGRNDQTHIRAYVIGVENATALLTAERDENTQRKDFTPSEAVSLGKALEEMEKAEAKKRQQEGGRTKASGKLPPARKAKTRDRVAKAVGMSGRTYEKAKEVVAAAEKNPKLAPVVEEMDRTGNVERAHQKVKPPPIKLPPTVWRFCEDFSGSLGKLFAANDPYRHKINELIKYREQIDPNDLNNVIVGMKRLIERCQALLDSLQGEPAKLK